MRRALLGLAILAAPAAAEPTEEQYAAWSTEYGERYDRWYFEMLFDRDLYFHEGGDKDRSATTNLVDAHYSIALKKFGAGWAFAVEMVCPPAVADVSPDPSACRPVLRMVSPKPEGTRGPEWLADFLPRSREDMARVLGETFDWRETDLRSCPAALDKLAGFPAVASAIWSQSELDWLTRGVAPSSSDITVDGDGVSLRAAGRQDTVPTAAYFADQWNGGAAYDWARAMHDFAEPCLRPSAAPPPWEKALARPETNGPPATE